jgi:hypothetical protein
MRLNLRTRDDLRQFARATANQPSARLSKIAQNSRQSGRVQARALVAVDEWLVLGDVKSIGGSHRTGLDGEIRRQTSRQAD